MCRFVVVLFVLCVVLAFPTACGSGVLSRADGRCGQAVLSDWRDGRIDETYPEPYYLDAIDSLPEDLRAYTTARDDISRALLTHRGGRP
jgi:hypothetical protein